MKRLSTIITLCAALALIPTFAARAEVRAVSTALSSDGQLISLLSGTYGELFPSGNETQPDTQVLAIRYSTRDGAGVLRLVPATLDHDSKTAAELVVEPVSDITYVFWQSWSNLIQSRFRISAFDGATWSEPIDVARSGFAWRTSPAFAVTHDRLRPLRGDGAIEILRTVLHVIWSEEVEDGRWSTMYAPLVLENGEYVGHHPVLALNALAAEYEGGQKADMQIHPVIRPRNSENSIVAAFLDQGSGRIVITESKFLAGEVSILGSAVSEALAYFSPEGTVESQISAVQDRLRSLSGAFRPDFIDRITTGVTAFLSDQTADGDTDIASVRDGARAQLIDIGFRLTDGDIRGARDDARAQLIDIGVRGRDGGGPGSGTGGRHDARSVLVTSFEVPDLDSEAKLLLSNSGRHLALVWEEKNRIRFQESGSEGAWGEMQQLGLTDQLDAAAAMSLLQKRLDQR